MFMAPAFGWLVLGPGPLLVDGRCGVAFMHLCHILLQRDLGAVGRRTALYPFRSMPISRTSGGTLNVAVYARHRRYMSAAPSDCARVPYAPGQHCTADPLIGPL